MLVTAEVTVERNHTYVTFVTRHTGSVVSLSVTKIHTEENCTVVLFVKRLSDLLGFPGPLLPFLQIQINAFTVFSCHPTGAHIPAGPQADTNRHINHRIFVLQKIG